MENKDVSDIAIYCYRVWFKGKMLYPNDIEGLSDGNFAVLSSGYLCWIDRGGNIIRYNPEIDDVECMPNTGFRDVTGRYIYSGDILDARVPKGKVFVDPNDYDPEEIHIRGIVVWFTQRGGWGLQLAKIEDEVYCGNVIFALSSNSAELSEVVGNIFEDTELLE